MTEKEFFFSELKSHLHWRSLRRKRQDVKILAAVRVSTLRAGSAKVEAGNTKGGSITVTLTSCLTGLELAV